MPLFLTKLRPSHADPELMVDRQQEVRWLEQRIAAYLSDRAPDKGGVITVLGAKGVGKSIVTRHALDRLHQTYGRTAVFVAVDCRRQLSQRKVLRQLADALHQELARMLERKTAGITKELVDTAAVVKTLAGYTRAKLSVLHENLAVFKNASNLRIGGKLLGFLSTEFNIAITRQEHDRRAIEGEIQLDDISLREALIQLFHDLRAQHEQLDAVVYLDNIDELDHDACYDDAKRETIRAETLGLLDLCRAPVGLVLNMRTYYASTLLREVDDILRLDSLAPEHLRLMLEHRLAEEPPDNRRALQVEHWVETIDELSRVASTPFVFLRWLKYLTEWGHDRRGPLGQRLAGYAGNYLANISDDVLERVAAIFDPPTRTVSRDALLSACGGRDAVLSQLIHAQAVLPRDFWEPNEFTLDPELHYLHPALKGG
ncbi:MAG: ATP-binding protein [Myxococcales bacterium]|nr:ATP-binding protein [Myxococcales bacterium]